MNWHFCHFIGVNMSTRNPVGCVLLDTNQSNCSTHVAGCCHHAIPCLNYCMLIYFQNYESVNVIFTPMKWQVGILWLHSISISWVSIINIQHTWWITNNTDADDIKIDDDGPSGGLFHRTKETLLANQEDWLMARTKMKLFLRIFIDVGWNVHSLCMVS